MPATAYRYELVLNPRSAYVEYCEGIFTFQTCKYNDSQL